MFREHRPLWAEINLDNLIHNVMGIKSLLKPGTEYMAVVKADAYGHGAVEVAGACIECGARWLAVAMLDEALELRNAGIDCSILILGFTPPGMADTVVMNDISQTCYSYELAEALSISAVKLKKTARIHIAVDTGMGRVGFTPNRDSAEMIHKISSLPGIVIEGVFTHFATADEKDKNYTRMQYSKFTGFIDVLEDMGIDPGLKHAGNSAGIIDLPEFDLDAVRPGIIQYGLYPSGEVIKDRIRLKPVMSVKANIVHLKEVEPGTAISYGRKFITEKKSRIATLPVGYADGYTRLFYGKAKVIVNGRYAPVVGSICMDQCMVDVTGAGDVNAGDDVILLGEDKGLSITADDLADIMGTINYEIVCMISKRVPRLYIKDNRVVKVKNYLIPSAILGY